MLSPSHSVAISNRHSTKLCDDIAAAYVQHVATRDPSGYVSINVILHQKTFYIVGCIDAKCKIDHDAIVRTELKHDKYKPLHSSSILIDINDVHQDRPTLPVLVPVHVPEEMTRHSDYLAAALIKQLDDVSEQSVCDWMLASHTVSVTTDSAEFVRTVMLTVECKDNYTNCIKNDVLTYVVKPVMPHYQNMQKLQIHINKVYAKDIRSTFASRCQSV